MKTIEIPIQVPNGFKIDSLDKEKSLITCSEIPKSIIERIKTFQDAINELGEDDEDVKAYRVIENLPIPKHIIAQLQLVLIAKALNEGWTPDWSNSNQYKYYPWFDMESSSAGGFVYDAFVVWDSYSVVGSRLCFPSRELAEYAGKQFKDIYEEYFVIK
ncbi:hypothetical protein [Empedobacter brevis]|uniref:hypothetical protein n=1 Tax=Empedobacter brevis TaxID=247 RepID=UPI0028D87FED|nr:hypothetical protein [Empedobacter brevis]